MAIRDADLWHQVHAEREDGVEATFLIRDVEPRSDQPQIFVIQLPYPVTDDSKLPDPASHHRLDTFQEQWVEPACEALGWTLVASKSEDGSFYLYLYGNGDPNVLLEKLAPFDSELGFFHDRDADWSEYAALRDLVEQSEAASEDGDEEHDHVHTDECEHDHDHTHDHDHASNGVLVIDYTGDDHTRNVKATRAKATRAKATRAKATRAKATSPRTASKASKASMPKQAAARTTTKRTRTSKPARSVPTPKPAKRPAKKPGAATSSMTTPSAKKSSASRSSTRSAARKGSPGRTATKRR